MRGGLYGNNMRAPAYPESKYNEEGGGGAVGSAQLRDRNLVHEGESSTGEEGGGNKNCGD